MSFWSLARSLACRMHAIISFTFQRQDSNIVYSFRACVRVQWLCFLAPLRQTNENLSFFFCIFTIRLHFLLSFAFVVGLSFVLTRGSLNIPERDRLCIGHNPKMCVQHQTAPIMIPLIIHIPILVYSPCNSLQFYQSSSRGVFFQKIQLTLNIYI